MKSSQCGSFAVSQASDKDYMHSPRRPVSLSPAFEGRRGRLSRWKECRRVLARLQQASLTRGGVGAVDSVQQSLHLPLVLGESFLQCQEVSEAPS